MATISGLADRVRIELGDLGKSFVQQFIADGTTNRFKLDYSPLDAAGIIVFKNGVDISDATTIEESTGFLITDDLPADGDDFTVSGQYFRYFTQTEIENLVTDALAQHAQGHTDEVGRKLTLATLPSVEEYPVAIHATVLALYTLATDAAFDIDVAAPDGVSIPRSERYRQLMDMMNARQAQYRDLCANLNIGLYKIDVFNLNRISKMTNRLIPNYVPQEVDDRSFPQRVHVPSPTLGNVQSPWVTEGGDVTAYQGRSFSTALDYTGNWAGKDFTARLVHQRGSVQTVQQFTLNVETTNTAVVTAVTRVEGQSVITIVVEDNTGWISNGWNVFLSGIDSTVDGNYAVSQVDGNAFQVTGTTTTALALTDLTGLAEDSRSTKDYTFTLSLTKDQTLRIAERTYWSLSTVDSITAETIELKGGNFFTERVSTVVL